MDPKNLVLQHLDEAHAIETALVTTLTAHIAMASEGPYQRLLKKHLDETREQVQNIDRRRSELGGEDGRGFVAAGAGLVRDVIGQALTLAKGPMDVVRARNNAERMLKNAKDECATEALEIATYDALEVAAKAAGDTATAKLARDHRAVEERMLADLRKQLPKLAELDIAERTDLSKAAVAKATGASRSSSSGSRTRAGASRSASTRSGSSSSATKRSSSGSSSRRKSGSPKS